MLYTLDEAMDYSVCNATPFNADEAIKKLKTTMTHVLFHKQSAHRLIHGKQ
jgi:hypothetical protein